MRVAGDDHDDAVAIVLHEFQQRVDGFLAEVVTAAACRRRRQAVGLVDEQHAVERLAASLERLRRGLPDISGDQAGAVGLDDVSLAHDLERRKNFADHARDLGLADAGRPGEHHVLADRGDIEPCSRRFCSTFMRATSDLTSCLTGDKPTIASSLAIAAAIRASLSSAFCPVASNDVVDGDQRNIGRTVAGDPHRLRFPRLFKQRPHLAGIGPVLRLGPALDPWFQLGFEAIGEVELLPGRHAPEDFPQFVGIVGREIDGLAEAAAEARIAVDEAPHFVAVAGDDHDDAVAIVLHEFQQRIDRFLAEVLLPPPPSPAPGCRPRR